MNLKAFAILATVSLIPGVAGAQEMQPAPKCTSVIAPPPALAGWSAKQDLASAIKADELAQAALTPDHAATVALHPTREVSYIAQPEKPGGSAQTGGMLAVTITTAGTYQVNLSSGAWIDLLKDGAAVISSAHAPGPACTGIRKTVQFPLQPGRYVLQISANADPTIQVMVSRTP